MLTSNLSVYCSLARTHPECHSTSHSFEQFHIIHVQTHVLYLFDMMWYDTLRQQTKEKSDSIRSSIDYIVLVFVVVVLWFALCFYCEISFRVTYSNDLRAFEQRLDRSFWYYSFHRTSYLYCWVRAWHTDVSMIVPSHLFRHPACNSANRQYVYIVIECKICACVFMSAIEGKKLVASTVYGIQNFMTFIALITFTLIKCITMPFMLQCASRNSFNWYKLLVVRVYQYKWNQSKASLRALHRYISVSCSLNHGGEVFYLFRRTTCIFDTCPHGSYSMVNEKKMRYFSPFFVGMRTTSSNLDNVIL